jgi:hypothetical protein
MDSGSSVVGTTRATEPAVAVIQQRHLARSGNSPCHKGQAGRRAVTERKLSDEGEPPLRGKGKAARSSRNRTSPQRGRCRAWGEPVGAGGPSRPEVRPRTGSQPGGAAPAPRAAGAGNPVKSNAEKTAGEADAGGASSAGG